MQTNQTNEIGAEQTRLQEDREGRVRWKKWGAAGFARIAALRQVPS
jgi:hypothetical protein